MKKAKYETREQWLVAAAAMIAPRFKDAGTTFPVNVRYSCSLPDHGAFSETKRVLGQCWYSKASADNAREVFISPTLAKPAIVLGVLVHEMVHAALPDGTGHKGPFKRLALKIGLEGKMTSALPGKALADVLAGYAETLGDYPHAPLSSMKTGRTKQGTRLLKVECPGCGCILRMTGKWIDEVGLPTCGCGTCMVCDDYNEDEGES